MLKLSFSECRVFIILLVLHSTVCLLQQPCGFFEFSLSHKEVVSAEEDTVLNFTFKLNETKCNQVQSRFIRVAKNGAPQCHIRNTGRKWSITDHEAIHICRCSSQSGMYIFTKTVTRTDNALWKWTSHDSYGNTTAKESIVFNITPAAETKASAETSENKILMNVVGVGVALAPIFLIFLLIAIYFVMRKAKEEFLNSQRTDDRSPLTYDTLALSEEI